MSSGIEENFILQKEEPDNQFYVDEYQYKDNSVICFGINKYCNGLKEELNIHNSKQIDFSGKKLETLSNISQETKYKEFSSLIQLTTLEQEVLSYAITYLKGNSVKTALVDLFPRGTKPSDKGMINVPKDDEPVDTHTVVLYNTGKKILIIDPNNPQFSAHLANFKPEILEATYTPNDKYKIYSRPEGFKTGFAPDKFRDCIDIAVKLAFGLNNEKSIYKNIDEVVKSEIVLWVTNNDKIDNTIFYSKIIAVREKQKSDIEQIVKFNINQQKLNSSHKEVKLKKYIEYQDALKELKISYEKSIAEVDDNYLKELLGSIEENDF